MGREGRRPEVAWRVGGLAYGALGDNFCREVLRPGEMYVGLWELEPRE